MLQPCVAEKSLSKVGYSLWERREARCRETGRHLPQGVHRQGRDTADSDVIAAKERQMSGVPDWVFWKLWGSF